jgi:hypothetical protein
MLMELGGPLAMIMSPCRAAGMLLIMTVTLPMATVPPTWGTVPVNMGQAWKSADARQAGIPPMSTVGLPGPGPNGVPWLVKSPTLAAIGMLASFFFLRGAFLKNRPPNPLKNFCLMLCY